MNTQRLILSVLLGVMTVSVLSSCRPRANRNTRTQQQQRAQQQRAQQAQGGTTQMPGRPTASQIMARTDSVIARVAAMAEPQEMPPFASEPSLGLNPPRSPWGTPYVPRPNLSEYETFEAALAAFNGREYDKSIGLLSEVIVSGRPPELIPNAYYWMGESYYAMARYQEMLPYFEYTVKVGPQHKREIAMYKLSRAHFEMGNRQAATTWHQRLRAEYPRSTYSGRLRNIGVS